jgi:hypothetical protein
MCLWRLAATRVDLMYKSNPEQKPIPSDTKFPTIVVDGSEFRCHRLFFQSKQKAARAGYHPRSYWNKRGRDVIDVSLAAVVVTKWWRTFHPVEGELILAWSQANEYLVSTTKYVPESGCRGCWSVYTEDHTEPQKSVNKDKGQSSSVVAKQQEQANRKTTNTLSWKSLKTISTPSITTPPYDVENIANNDAKACKQQDLRQRRNETRLITKQPKSKGVRVYFPEGFPWDRNPDLNRYRSTVMWLAHKLHERRFVNNENEIYDPDAFIRINSRFARNICPNFSTVVKLLIELDIIERDFYQPKTKSYGYRFSNLQLRKATRRRVPLDDAKMAKRINSHRQKEVSTRTDRWLHSMLFKLALDDVDEAFLNKIALLSYRERGGSIEDKLMAYAYWLERIAYQEHVWSRDDQGRRYSIVTNLKRELRSFLRVDGRRLQQIDIAKSQWMFLALEMRRAGVACHDYCDLCEQGELYETVAKAAKSTRPKVKTILTQRALFSPNDVPCQRTKIKNAFDKMFPEVAEYLRDSKRNGDGSRLAKTLQAAEAELIIEQVCGRLRREGQVRFVTPVHDCLLFLPWDSKYVRSVMLDEFAELGIQPRLEIKDLNE